MSINSYITDPATKLRAEVVDGEEQNGLVVATRPLKQFQNVLRYFSNDEFGIDLNQDASAGGTPLKVHNGGDDVLWTGSNIVGTADFADAAQNHTSGGAASIGFDAWSASGDTAQIAKGSSQDLSGYIGLTLWVYVDSNWGSDSVSIYGWDTGTGTQVGLKGLIEEKIDVGNTDVWQKAAFEIGELGLTGETIDAIRIQYETRTGAPTNFYIDDIQFEETGSPVTFSIEPDQGTWLRVKSFQVVFADEYDTTLLNGTMPGIPWDQILGVTIGAGILYQRTQDGEVVSNALVTKFVDFMSFSNATVTGSGYDGTTSWLSVNIQFNEEVILKSENEDKMTLTIAEDFSGLDYFRVGAGCKVEERL